MPIFCLVTKFNQFNSNVLSAFTKCQINHPHRYVYQSWKFSEDWSSKFLDFEARKSTIKSQKIR